MQWEIYTTGGAYYLWDVFQFLAAYTSGGNFRNLLQIGVIIGLAWATLQLAFGGSLGAAMKYVLTMVIVMMIVLGPKSSVVIIDKTMGTIPIYGIVDNVPTSVAMLGHYTSAVGYYLTGQMETLMSTPTDLTYQKNGILFGATLMSQAAGWRAVTPLIHENLVNFMQQCAIDAANLGHTDLEMLATNGNMETFMASNMPQSLAYYDVVQGQTRPCSEGWNDVRNSVNQEVNTVLAQKASSIFQGSNANGPANIARLQGTLGDFQELMAMSSASSVHTIRQAMYVTAMDDGMRRFIAMSGNNAAMEIYQMARADIQTRASYSAIGANAAKWVPLLKIVFETLYYAAFPLAVFMMMTPLAPAILKGYMGGFVWIAAWEPLSAILHSIVIKASAGYYRAAGAVTSDGSVQDVVLSWANHFGIRAVEQDVGTVAGFLMMSVPFLATAIMFGANRMVGMATSMLNVSQGAAIETGREAATGSISLANLSMNNYAANKKNLSSMVDTGRDTMIGPNGAAITRNMDGMYSIQAGSSVSSGGITSQIGQSVRSEIAQRAESSRTAAMSAAQEYTDYMSRSASELTSFARNMSTGTNYTDTQGSEASNQTRRAASESWSRVEDFASQQGISTDLAMKIGAAVGLGTPGISAFRASIDGGGHISGQSTESITQALRAAESYGLNTDVANIQSYSDSVSRASSTGSSDTMADSRNNSLEEGRRLAESYLTRLDEAETYANAASRLESAGASFDTNLNQVFANKLVQQGLDPISDVPRVMSPQTPQEVERSQGIIGGLVSKVVDQFVGGAPVDPTAGYSANMNRDALRAEPMPDSAQISGQPISRDDMQRGLEERAARHQDLVATPQREARVETGRRLEGEREQTGELRDSLSRSYDDTSIGGAMLRRVPQALGITDSEMNRLRSAHPSAWSSPGAAMDYYAENPDKFQEVLGRRPFSDGAPANNAPVSTGSSSQTQTFAGGVTPPAPPLSFTQQDRDVVIRTMLGEAANEGDAGLAAVAWVIRNRAEDPRWPSTVGGVATQSNANGIHQFSVWNEDSSGNNIPQRYNPGDRQYERAAYIFDVVMGGQVRDNTQGATHYYAPRGMQALVDSGYQSNIEPRWLASETAARGGSNIEIGGHIFTGRARPKR